MANALLTPKVFSDTALTLLVNNLILGKKVATTYKNDFKSIGSSVSVKRPPEFIVANGPNLVPQDVIEGETTVTIDQQKHVDVQFSSLEDTLTVTQLLRNATMNSAMAQLAQSIDSSIAAAGMTFSNYVGTPGTTINSSLAVFRASQRMEEMGVPGDDLNMFLSPADGFGLAQSLAPGAANNNFVSDIARTALEKARVPMVANEDIWRTQSIASLTTGTRTNGTVNGAGQNVTYLASKATYTQTLNVSGLGAGGTVNVGDTFTLAGVQAVNPRTKAPLPYLKQFVVVTAATADGTGNAALTIQDPIITTGAYQNVSAAPANGAAVTWVGAASTTYPQNFACHKQAIQLVYAKLTDPYTGECTFSTDPVSGVSLRYWRSSDITTDNHIHRFEVLYGVKNVDPRLGTRVAG